MNVDKPKNDKNDSDNPQGGYFHDLWKNLKTEFRRPRFFLEIAVLIAGVVYTTYTIKMFHTNKIASDSAESAADTAQQTLIATNRSWLEITIPQEVMKSPKSVKDFERIRLNLKQLNFPLNMTNIGKSPVKNIQIISDAEVLHSTEASNFSYGTPQGIFNSTFISIVYPTRSAIIPTAAWAPGSKPASPDNKIEVVTPELREDLRQARKYIVVYARGTFDDDLGSHWVQFCGWIAPTDFPANFPSGNCVAYNGTGDLPKK